MSSPEDEGTLEIDQQDAVRWLWLNRPDRRNALDDALIVALNDAISDAEADAGTRALLLAGRGNSFCAGADLAVLLEHENPVEFVRQISNLVSRLESSLLPVVVAIHGHAVAGGLELALAADVVLAAESALIGDGHVRNGLIPGGGSSVRLPEKVGAGPARWMLLSGELVRASSLHAAGWLHAVVSDDQLYEAAGHAAALLAERGGPAQARIKSLLTRRPEMRRETALEAELDAFAAHWAAASVADQVRAFFENPVRSAATVAVADADGGEA